MNQLQSLEPEVLAAGINPEDAMWWTIEDHAGCKADILKILHETRWGDPEDLAVESLVENILDENKC